MADVEVHRSRFPTIVGTAALLLGLWSVYFLLVVREFFDQMVSSSGPRGGPLTYGPRPEIEPWVLLYCAASTGLMVPAGIGLLRRKRWSPALAGLAGTAWAVGSLAFLYVEFRVLRGISFSPSIVRLYHVAYAGAALIVTIHALCCLSCVILRSVREECGAESPSWFLILGMGTVAAASIALAAWWTSWYWRAWGFLY